MAKTGRKLLAMPRSRCTLYIRTDLLAKVELLLLDPMRERAKYGARTEYIEGLIERDIRERSYAGLVGSTVRPDDPTEPGIQAAPNPPAVASPAAVDDKPADQNKDESPGKDNH